MLRCEIYFFVEVMLNYEMLCHLVRCCVTLRDVASCKTLHQAVETPLYVVTHWVMMLQCETLCHEVRWRFPPNTKWAANMGNILLSNSFESCLVAFQL